MEHAGSEIEIGTRVIGDVHGRPLLVDAVEFADGFPVLVHHGSPGSRRLFRRDADVAAADFGLRLISFDRPGYAGRGRRRGRQVADVVEDVRAIAEAFDIDRMATWGFSGGGPFALACASQLPELICGAAVLASFAPFGSPGLDFVGDWPQEYRDEVDLFFTDPGLAREHWRADAESILATCSDARGWMTRWGETAGDKSHSSDLAEHLAAEVRDALADGDDGWWDDWAATLNPWGFDLGDIRAPVHLWHGTADRNVPVANGRWLAEHVPGITAEFPEGQDHTTIEDVARRDAYAWLRSTF